MARGLVTHPAYVQRILDLNALFMSAADIQRQLEKDQQAGMFPNEAGGVPPARTVQNIVRPYKKKAEADTERWSLDTADPDEIRFVMPVLAYVIDMSGGRRPYLTKAEARLVIRISLALQIVNPVDVWRFVRSFTFVRSRPSGDPTYFNVLLALRRALDDKQITPERGDELLQEIGSRGPGAQALWDIPNLFYANGPSDDMNIMIEGR